MMDIFPYRHVGTEGTAAGWSFIYYDGRGGYISYRTDNPVKYFATLAPDSYHAQVLMRETIEHKMTDRMLAHFESIPTHDQQQARAAEQAKIL